MADTPSMAVRATLRAGKSFYRYLLERGARNRAFEDPPDVPGEQRYSVSTRATEKGYSIHVQFYARDGWMYIYGHIEPDSIADPLGHVWAWLSGEGVGQGLGRQAVRQMFRSWARG